MEFIYVIPIGGITKTIISFARRTIEATFDCICNILNGQDIPQQAYDERREQYLSTSLLRNILTQCPKDAMKILGVTDVDIFVPVLTFVFGQAQLNGRAAIVSTYRLRQEFYGLVPNDEVMMQRLGKEIIHELGHTFGLVHCKNPLCVMHFSNFIGEIDVKSSDFCPSCKRILRGRL